MAALGAVGSWIASSSRVLVFSGAGISTESGIPDFRGPSGVWRTLDPARFTLRSFLADAEVRRETWRRRRSSPVDAARPNLGHRAIADLERAGHVRLVVTQNVDGLHQAAGSLDVVELHGTTREAACLGCRARMPIGRVLDRVAEGDDDPHCELCGGLIKPATISFGQNLVEADVDRAMAAAAECDVCLAVGSTLAVWPAAGIPLHAARTGARLVIVNDGPTELDPAASALIGGRSGEVLPRLVEAVAAASGGPGTGRGAGRHRRGAPPTTAPHRTPTLSP